MSKYICPICKHEVTIEKISQHSGMDGYYDNWIIQCNNCKLVNVEYPADSFYGRDYYKTEESALEAYNSTCQKYYKKGE